eukprot:1860349-Amphidinium_carterae.1
MSLGLPSTVKSTRKCGHEAWRRSNDKIRPHAIVLYCVLTTLSSLQHHRFASSQSTAAMAKGRSVHKAATLNKSLFPQCST